ncbi:hypothetical protein FRC10_001143 [Ceratobasidium sp. 414]|nr:hypothetical protein FRC10_001143 [Ceratobasidium sp. 414]
MQTVAELSTVHISSKLSRDSLPPQQHLRRFLRVFGKIIALHEWSSDELGEFRPNNALVMFEAPSMAQEALESSARHAPDSFWTTQSLIAHPLTSEFRNVFDKEINSKRYLSQLKDPTSASVASPSSRLTPDLPRSQSQSPFPRSRRNYPEPSQAEPPMKKPRRASPCADPIASGSNQASSSKHALDPTPTKSYAGSPIPPSTEWMQARIEQLEAQLGASNAARDVAVSEQAIMLRSYEAEQEARLEALAQKSAAEAAVSRANAEQARLLEELNKQRQESPEKLRSQLKNVEAMLLEVRNSTEGREALLKRREFELEEAQDDAHKLRIKLAQIEQDGPAPDALLQEARDEAEGLGKQLEEVQEELEGTRTALEKARMKYSSEKGKHKATKEKLAECKARLKSNSTMSEQLRNSAPAALEGLKAVISAMGLPPLRDLDQALTPKTESE